MIDPLELILAPSVEAFVSAARAGLADPESLDLVVPALLRETALRHYRSEYPKHIPHALLALLGGLESRDLLEGPERAWPLLKALSYVAREQHADPFPVEELGPAGGDGELADALENGEFEVAYRAVRALLASGRRDRVRDSMLAFASRDTFNLGHRMIYAVKVFERLDRTSDEDAEALLFPVTHYLCLAPRDGALSEFLAEGGALPPGGDIPLPGTCSETIRRVTAAGDREATRLAVKRALGKKGNAVDLLDVVFLLSVHRLGTAVDVDWVPMAHVANFAEAMRYWLTVGTSPERFRAPYLAALFLADTVARIGPGECPAVRRSAESDPDRLLRMLGSAIRERNEIDARSASRALLDHPGRRADFEREILLACAHIDGHHAFGHDVKIAANAVRIGRMATVSGLDGVLGSVAAFLARLPEGDDLGRALFDR